jgi:hypothetical protein
MTDADEKLPEAIEVYEVGARRLYAKTHGRSFALFEDELTPEELMAIAKDITARRQLANSEVCGEPNPV